MKFNKKIVFLGSGYMCQWIIQGLLNAGYNRDNIIVASPNTKTLNFILDNKKITYNVLSDNNQAIEQGDIIVLAFKPYQAQQVLSKITASMHKKLVISPLAGIKTTTIHAMLNNWQINIVRNMPNAGVAEGVGAGGYYISEKIKLGLEETTIIKSIMLVFGCPLQLNKEEQINAVTAISGSGIAYVFLIIAYFLKNNVRLGITEHDALQKLENIFNPEMAESSEKRAFKDIIYVMKKVATTLDLTAIEAANLVDQTFVGGLAIFKASLDNYATNLCDIAFSLIAKVGSNKLGTTAAALASFEKNNFERLFDQLICNSSIKPDHELQQELFNIFKLAIYAAYIRSEQIGIEEENKLRSSL